MFFQQLRAIVIKDWTLRRRHSFQTFLELFIPIIVVFAFLESMNIVYNPTPLVTSATTIITDGNLGEGGGGVTISQDNDKNKSTNVENSDRTTKVTVKSSTEPENSETDEISNRRLKILSDDEDYLDGTEDESDYYSHHKDKTGEDNEFYKNPDDSYHESSNHEKSQPILSPQLEQDSSQYEDYSEYKEEDGDDDHDYVSESEDENNLKIISDHTSSDSMLISDLVEEVGQKVNISWILFTNKPKSIRKRDADVWEYEDDAAQEKEVFDEPKTPKTTVNIKKPKPEAMIRIDTHFLVFSLLYNILNIAVKLVQEKTQRTKELCRIMGMSNCSYWLAQYFSYMLVAVWHSTVISVIIASYRHIYQPLAVAKFLLIFLLFYSATISMVFLFSCFFNRTITVTITLGILYQFALSLSAIIDKVTKGLDNYIKIGNFPIKSLTVLIPQFGLGWAIKGLINGQEIEQSLKLASLTPNSDPSLTLAIIGLLIASPMFLLLTLYFDACWCWQPGTSENCCFPCCYCCPSAPIDMASANEPELDEQFHEPPFRYAEVIIRCHDLSKSFRDWFGNAIKVLDKVNLSVMKGHITVLLGHNGVGKTTTMNLISGYTKPDSGSVLVKGFNVRKQPLKARRTMAYCPQENVAWQCLTVREHFIFTATMRGLDKVVQDSLVEDIIQRLDLTDYADHLYKTLSGGMHRRVQLGLTLATAADILILDEPTSGLDPLTRRKIWDLLIAIRRNHTILLTTQSMEEADTIGDRIIFLSQGQVKVSGSTMFLKKKFGTGYKISMAKSDEFNETETLFKIKQHFPNANINNQTSSEVIFQLKAADSEANAKLPQLCDQLESCKSFLGINSFSISSSTLEDVIIKLQEEASNEEILLTPQFDPVIVRDAERDEVLHILNYQPYREPILTGLHIRALLVKRAILSRRNLKVLFAQIFMPAFFLSFAFMFIRNSTLASVTDPLLVRCYLSMFVPMGVAILASSFYNVPSDENHRKTKLLQTIAGVKSITYWTVNLSYDFNLLMISSIIMIAVAFALDNHNLLFTDIPLLSAFILLFPAFGVSIICLSYFLSLLPMESSFGFNLILSIYAVLSILGSVLLAFVDEIKILRPHMAGVGTLFKLFPPTAFSNGFAKTYSQAIWYKMCLDNKDKLCLPEALKNLELVNLQDKAGEMFPRYKQCCTENSEAVLPTPYSWSEEGLLIEIVFMVLVATITIGAIILFENHVNWFGALLLPSWLSEKRPRPSPEDDDVQEERLVVRSHLIDREFGEKAVITNHLTRDFWTERVVNDVTLAISRRECFGLLGPNGAGKTTVFRLFTGDLCLTLGNAYINTIKCNARDTIRDFQKHISYCPQSEALHELLTPRETLKLYAKLRGIPRIKAKENVDYALNKTGLDAHANKLNQNLSSGSKKKLQLAIAALGTPELLILDEPTNGIDPVSRRKIWHILGNLKELISSTVILSSHSMDECEALCSRIGILVNGRLECLGSACYLKEKFAQGYTLKIKVLADIASNGEKMENLKEKIRKVLPEAIIDDIHQAMIYIRIGKTTSKWADIFRSIDKLKRDTGQIDDFLVMGTTLEQIFLAFAQPAVCVKQQKISLHKRLTDVLCECFCGPNH